MTGHITIFGTAVSNSMLENETISIDPSQIRAVSLFCAGMRCKTGRSVHMKDGTAIGVTENLSDILKRAAEIIGEDAVKNIKVIIHDKTSSHFDYPRTKLRTDGQKGMHLEDM